MSQTALGAIAIGARGALALACLTLFGCSGGGGLIPAGQPQQSIRQVRARQPAAAASQPLMQQRVQELRKSVSGLKHFSAVNLTCDGKTDISASLQAMIESTGQAGGGIIDLPNGICATSKTIVVDYSNVTLLGQGSGFVADAPQAIATGLVWIGAPGGTLLQYGSANRATSGGGLDGIALLSNNGSAGYGLVLAGVSSATFTSFATDAFSVVSVQVGTTAPVTKNLIANFDLDNESNTGASIVLGTTSNASATKNEFDNAFVQIDNGTGIELLASKDNLFNNTHEFMDKGGLGLGVRFGCGSTHNSFVWLSAGYANNHDAVLVEGTQACTRHAVPKADSIVLYDQNDNGGPRPVVARGATFACTNDINKPCGQQSPRH
jgi:hypothetical protein